MESPARKTDSQNALSIAFDTLLMTNVKIRNVHKRQFCASELWRVTLGDSEDNDQQYPEHWIDPVGRLDWNDPEAGAWMLEARNMGLLNSRTALKEELQRLGSWRKDLEYMQSQLRALINDLSRPSLRSWHILDLPEEILAKVFECLDQRWPLIPLIAHVVSKDISNCRLVCQRFCRTSSRFLLPSVSVDLRLSSMSRFEEISRHPTISKGISVIRVLLHYYDPLLSESMVDFIQYHAIELEQQIESMEAWRPWEFRDLSEEIRCDVLRQLKAILASWRRLVAQPQVILPGEDDELHQGLLKAAHQRYQKLYVDQEEMRNSGRFCNIIAKGLLNMPGARTLYIRDEPSLTAMRPSLFETDDINLLVYEAVLKPIDYYTAYKHGFSPKLYDIITELPPAVPHVFEQVEIDLSYVEAPSSLLARPELQLQLSSVLQQLKDFAFKCRIWMNGDSGEDALCSVLAPWVNTPGLEALQIDMARDEESDDEAMPYVGRLLTFGQQQNMSDVFLRDVAFQLSELQLFIRGSQKPYCSLTLERTRLLNGTWEKALDSLRNAAIRSVTLFSPLGAECDDMPPSEVKRIFGRSDALAWSEAEQYIRHVIPRNPLRDRTG